MEAWTVWEVYPQADRAALDTLVACAAERLGIGKPDTDGTEVVFPGSVQAVTEALDACDPDWRDKGLLMPPG